MQLAIPFFKRTLLPLTRGIAVPGILFAFGALLRWCEADPAALIGVAFMFAAPLSLFNTWRAIDSDEASGTLVHLAVLPVGRCAISLGTAAGFATGYTALAMIPILVGSSHGKTEFHVTQLLTGIACAYTGALLGTLPPLRHGMSRVQRFAAAVIAMVALVGLLGEVSRLTVHSSGPEPFFLTWCAALTGFWAVAWLMVSWLGSAWTGDPGHAPKRPDAAPAGPMRLTPDNFHPLLWRELTTGLRWLIGILLFGLAFIAYSFATLSFEYRWNTPVSQSLSLLWLLAFYASAATGQRTSRDQFDGMWQDVAVTPLSRASILWTRVLGVTAQVTAVSVVWGLVVTVLAALCGSPAKETIMAFVVAPLMIGGTITLTGFVSGASSRGVLAAIGGLVLVYLMMMLSYLPGGLVYGAIYVTLGGRVAESPFAIISAIVTAVTFFYGFLIWTSMRQIRKSVETQRA